jgi:hypothetical protein
MTTTVEIPISTITIYRSILPSSENSATTTTTMTTTTTTTVR